ncbi:hypothetical protein [Magnetospirillum sp. XM-1]|nr:hypothetical protein [Magnetospirillum sp. XM-1]
MARLPGEKSLSKNVGANRGMSMAEIYHYESLSCYNLLRKVREISPDRA